MSDNYEEKLAAWRAKYGITTAPGETPTGEDFMVAEDARRAGKGFCGHCAEQFPLSEMRLVTRSDDPYIQIDDEPNPGKPDWYIRVGQRVRMCKPCFKERYESEDQP